MHCQQNTRNTDPSKYCSPCSQKKVFLSANMHKIRQEVHPEKECHPHRNKNKNYWHSVLFMLSFFLKNDIVFSDREFFLQDTIDLVPTEDNPRAKNQEKKSNNKTEDSWIEEDSNTQNQTNCSKENHRISLYQFSPRYKKNPSFLRDWIRIVLETMRGLHWAHDI